jgi:hypothetical protein
MRGSPRIAGSTEAGCAEPTANPPGTAVDPVP